MKPYYADDHVELYLGDMREVLPALGLQADLVCTDPPYGETALAWDRWPDGWPALAATVASSMWCFGSMRMFLDRRHDFDDWKLSQDVVWEKANGSGFARDRFRRVHEIATHWYRGAWRDIHHDTPPHRLQRTRQVRPRPGIPHPAHRRHRPPHLHRHRNPTRTLGHQGRGRSTPAAAPHREARRATGPVDRVRLP